MTPQDEDQVARFMLGHLGDEAATVAAAIEAEAAMDENADKAERWQRIAARILAITAVEGPFRAPVLAPPSRRRRRRSGASGQAMAQRVLAASAEPTAPAPQPAEIQTVATRVPWLRLVIG